MTKTNDLSDLEKVKRCADRAGVQVRQEYAMTLNGPDFDRPTHLRIGATYTEYNPLKNKAQAFELEEWLRQRGVLAISPENLAFFPRAGRAIVIPAETEAERLAALVECVSQIEERAIDGE